MVKNWIRYLLVLVGTGAFFICYNGYLSLYVFALSVALPLVSLVVSLPGMLGARAALSMGKENQGEGRGCWARKGESIPLRLEVWNATPFSSGRVRATLTVKNTFTGQWEKEQFVCTAGPHRQVFQHSLSSRTCGRVVCRLDHLWVWDYLGLFPLPLRGPGRQEVAGYFWPTVSSLDLEIREESSPGGEGERYSSKKPGDDPTELFALRDWREGDKLSRIHWKLSQKLERTLVKELGLPLSDHLLFLLDLNGEGWESDLLLDALASLSSFLAEREHAHRVLCWDSQGLQVRCWEITQPQDLLPLWQDILDGGSKASLPALREEQLPEGVTHGVYLCSQPQKQPFLALEDKYPGARVTVIRTREALPQQGPPHAADSQQILLQPGRVAESLNGLIL